MLTKNTLIDLWSMLSNIPTVINDQNVTVLDEDFLGWPVGTDVETVWHWFDDQFADFGGVHALMYDNPQPDRKFQVWTPRGILECYAKHEGKVSGKEIYPGVYINLRVTDEQKASEVVDRQVCCVEYDSCSKHLQTLVYQLMVDEPTHFEVYEPLMTFGEFLDEYSNECVELEVFDTDGNEVSDEIDIPDDTPILGMSRHSGSFTLYIDLSRAAPKQAPSGLPERISIYAVRRGLTDGVIKLGIVDDEVPTVVAEIGEHWFYFGGHECEGVTTSIHIDTTPFEDDVQAIHEALNAEPINGMTEDESTECLYYRAVLNERFREADAPFKGKEKSYPIEDQIDACYAYLNWTDRKDPHDMTEDELAAAEKELAECEPGIAWVAHAGYAQAVPQDKRNGFLILS